MGFKQFVMKNLPTILTVAGCVGVGATVFFAVKVTPEAKRRVDELKKEKEDDIYRQCEQQWLEDNGYCKGGENEGEEPDEAELLVATTNLMDEVPEKYFRPTPIEVVKEVAVLYLPATLMGAASIAAFVSANTVSVKRLTATSAALTATEEAFRTYRNKVVEQIGEKKAAEVIAKIAEDKVKKNPPKLDETDTEGKPVIITGDGDTLCYESYTGRYFKSNIDKLRRIETHMNQRLMHEDFISLNDLYDEIGLPPVKMGDDLGWNVMDDTIDFTISSTIIDKDDREVTCTVLDLLNPPRERYMYGDLKRW